MVNRDNAFDRLLRQEKRAPKKRGARPKKRGIGHWRSHLQRALNEISLAGRSSTAIGDDELRQKFKALRKQIADCLGHSGRISYNAYIGSAAWGAKREAALRRYGQKCNRCGTTDAQFQVHHLTYKRLGKEKMADLEVLCKECHQIEHEHKHGPGGALYEEFRQIFQ